MLALAFSPIAMLADFLISALLITLPDTLDSAKKDGSS